VLGGTTCTAAQALPPMQQELSMRRSLRTCCRSFAAVLLAAWSLAPGCAGIGVPGLDLGTSNGSNNAGGGSASVSASVLEQLSLERINRARLRPAQEAALFGISLDEGVSGQIDASPKQPVAMNTTLRSVAAAHAQDMLNRDYFEHNTPEGVTPFARMSNGGYLFSAAGENLAWRGSTGPLDDAATVELQHEELFVDAGVPGRGHRVTMLNALFREVGIAVVEGSFTRASDGVEFTHSYMQVQDYGAMPDSVPFVMGVVYDDGDGNGRYDAGEGVGNANVSLGTDTVRTNSAGGYSFEVQSAGTYELRFSSTRATTLMIAPGDPNQKVDFVDREIVVNLGLGPLN
jgi:hypothetical protein